MSPRVILCAAERQGALWCGYGVGLEVLEGSGFGGAGAVDGMGWRGWGVGVSG
jgi:hypothetical protein